MNTTNVRSSSGSNQVQTPANEAIADLEEMILDLSRALSEVLKLVNSLGEDDVIANLSQAQKRDLAGKMGGIKAGASSRGKVVGGYAGPAGFLWKPVSDSTGKLAILLPSELTGKVKGVSVLGPDSRLIESGSNGGVGNGGREHFRFSRPGGSYPPGSIVAITLNDGRVQHIKIDRPGVRIEGR